MEKYLLPEFLKFFEYNTINFQKKYKKWLDSQASRHHKRDKEFYKKHNMSFLYTKKMYKEKIHEIISNNEYKGTDYYTGEMLDWCLIGSWNNEQSKKSGYKKLFHNMPTLEHIDRDNLSNNLDFAICGWAVNDAKNDLSKDNFIEMCKKVVAYANKNS